MPVRLNKALKEIGVGINTVAEFLQNKGYALQDASPNAKITDEQYRILMEAFGADKRKQEEIQKHLETMRLEEEKLQNVESPESVELQDVSDNKDESNGIQESNTETLINANENYKELKDKKEEDWKEDNIQDNNVYSFNGIPIGRTSIDWKYAISEYTIELEQSWPLKVFEKVICKLLYELDCNSTVSNIGECLGFNVVDDPINLKYKDETEYKILYKELQLLEKYGLIELDGESIYLQPTGVNAVITGKRIEEKSKDIKLYFDSISNSEYATKLFKNEPGITIEEEIPLNYNDKDYVKEQLLKQYPEYLKNKLDIEIKDFHNKSLIQKQLSVVFDIFYDFNLKEYKLRCVSENAEIYDDILENDMEFHNSILKSFFNSLKEAVIYKPKFQEDYEIYISKQNDSNLFIERLIVGSKFNYIINIPKALNNNIPPLMCFYVDELTEEFNQKITKFCEKMQSTLVCVEFVSGDEKYSNYYFKNLKYNKVEHLSCDNICVCANDFSFKEELCVLPYNGIYYQIPLVVSILEKKYIMPKLAKNFVSGIEQIINLSNDIFNNGDRTNIFNTFKKIIQQYTLVKSLQDIFTDEIIDENLKKKIEYQDNDIYIFIGKIIELIEKRNDLSGKDLMYFEEVCNLYAKNYLPKIEKIKESKFKNSPIIVKPNVWILDTNVCLDDPDIIEKFKPVVDLICIIRSVKSEIDRKAHLDDSLGERAKNALRKINIKLDTMPNLIKIFDLTSEDLYKLPIGMDKNLTDNQIIAMAMKLNSKNYFNSVTIITNDNNLRSDAISLKLNVISLENFISDREE